MKKITGIILFALVLYLVGCRKDDLEISENAMDMDTKTAVIEGPVRVQDNMLYFASVEDYGNTIDYLAQLGDENFADWEDQLSFNSMRKMMTEEEREKIGIEDDLFATLLNPDGMIHIGEYIFQVDVPHEHVFMVRDTEYEGSKLSSISVFNTKADVRVFSIDDDILGVPEGEEIAIEKSSGCPRQKKGYYRTYTNYGWVDRKVAYQKAGIYFSIIGKIKQEYAYPRCYISLKTWDYDGDNYGVKKWSDCDHKINFNRGWKSGYGSSYSWRPYNSWRGLKKYKWHVQFYYDDDNDGWMPKLLITCNNSCN